MESRLFNCILQYDINFIFECIISPRVLYLKENCKKNNRSISLEKGATNKTNNICKLLLDKIELRKKEKVFTFY